MAEQTESRPPLDSKATADLIQAAVTAAGFASMEAVHASLTRKLQRVAEQTARALAVLGQKPDPDLTMLVEHIGGLVREAQTSAAYLDFLGTLGCNVAELRDRAAAAGGAREPAVEEQPPPTTEQTEVDRG